MANDSSVIASCSDDKTTRLWSLDSGKCIYTYKEQNGYGTYLAWHPSGCYIAVGTSNGNVKMYDIRTHDLIQYYRCGWVIFASYHQFNYSLIKVFRKILRVY